MSLLSITGGITGGADVNVLIFFAGLFCGWIVAACAAAALVLWIIGQGETPSLARPIDCFTNPELFTAPDAIAVAPKDGGRNE